MPPDRDIQFSALRILVAVAESDTLTSAARKLGVTQSAVSQAIAQLESITETELVVRRSRPVRLTPAGQIAKRHADSILSDTRQMLKDVAAASTGDLPRLAIGSIDSFADVGGQELMMRIGTIAPQLSVQTGLAMPLSDALLSGDLDILITSDPLEDHPELECHPILRDPFVVLAAKSHRGAAEATVKSLANELPFVRYTAQSRLGMMTDLALRRIGIQIDARFEFDDTQALLKTVRAGEGWAVATSLCVTHYPDLLEDIQVLPLASGASARYICLLARENELGETPATIAEMCRSIYSEKVLPKTLQLMPWLEGDAVEITDAPMIWSA